MRPAWLARKAVTFFVIKTHLSLGLGTGDDRTPYAGAASGGDRNSAMSRKMSANRFLEMATSTI
jgi:hypothetical protein